jgi:hypothetical protein
MNLFSSYNPFYITGHDSKSSFCRKFENYFYSLEPP